MKAKPVVVQKADQEEVTYEVIAQSIRTISESMRKLRAANLNNKAILLLIHDSSKVSKAQIHDVLVAMESLERTYLKPPLSK